MPESAAPAPARPAGESPPLVAPDDEPNRQLVANVHPSDWTNPTPRDRYHLVVLGAGTAGLVTAAGAASLGARVALVERHLMGGDCLNVGCVPSKGVISAARSWSAARRSASAFHGPAASGEGDFAKAMERMRRLRARISPGDSASRFTDLGVDVFFGEGRFLGPRELEVGGQKLQFKKAVIATGARAFVPPIAGFDTLGYLTNENVFSLTELPRRLTVIGAGPIGCEMAQAFARLGSAVTVLDIADHVLPREDPDAAQVVERSMERDGVVYLPDSKVVRGERTGEGRTIVYEQAGAKKRIEADEVLVAIGRAPNVAGIGLEAAGVAYDKFGVKVDDRLRTTNRRIFAAGDVASRYKFTHAADFQARLVIANSLFWGLGGGRASRLVIPWCTYTSPEIAHVGMYEADARKAGHEVETITVALAEVDRAILEGQDEGFVRVHLKKGSDKILGATIVAEHAGEMIGELSLALTHKIGLAKIGQTIHPYPTQAEAIRKAADELGRKRLTPSAKKLFERFFRIF